ncbi:MAG: Spy/CpxP family protein refolding chaperone [Helicobacteraceae bacterium]|jgi:Spy/CpxP family protein refolding chaperone|nr:Spy/CpxP family protein refolding chaperone [Helicobacteraceae bacterium]
MKRVLISAALAMALSSAAFAAGEQGQCPNGGVCAGQEQCVGGKSRAENGWGNWGNKDSKGRSSKDARKRMHKMFAGLDLTKDQSEKLAKIHEKHFVGGMFQDENPLEKAFAGDKFDRSAFVNAMNANSAQTINKQADFFAEVFDVLTPEQRAAWLKNMREMRSNFMGGGKKK